MDDSNAQGTRRPARRGADVDGIHISGYAITCLTWLATLGFGLYFERRGLGELWLGVYFVVAWLVLNHVTGQQALALVKRARWQSLFRKFKGLSTPPLDEGVADEDN